MGDFRSYSDFVSAGHGVLKLLHDRIPFDLWMITRVVGDDWIVLQVEDYSYGVREGSVFGWTDSFCSRMVKGEGPCIAPQADLVKAYRYAPISQQVKIGAYVGMPLCFKDGSLFGTLCAIHPISSPHDLQQELPLLEVLAKLLGTLLDEEMHAQKANRRAERAELEAQTDSLTGLYNRRGWDKLLAAEETRCHDFGTPACIIMIDLDNFKLINDNQGHAAGDRYLQRFAQVLKSVLRKEDIAARIGGDEFAVLGVDVDYASACALTKRVEQVFQAANMEVSVGLAYRKPSAGLKVAWREADAAMYLNKKRKKSASFLQS